MASTVAVPSQRRLTRRDPKDGQGQIVQHSYQAGEVIWRTHGPLRFQATLQSGEIALETWVDGRLVRTRRLYAGNTLPPRSLQSRRPHALAIARAVTDVRIGILPDLQAQPAKREKVQRGMPALILPMLLLVLVVALAREDLARIASGLFYLAATHGQAATPADPRALSLLEAAQKVDPGAAFAYNEQGYHLFLQEKLPEAATAFDAAVARDPANGPALNNLAVTDFLRGDFAQADRYFQRAVDQAPDNPAVRYNLAMTLMRLGQPSSALSELREAGFIDPRDVSPLLQQAYLYQQAGDYANAEQSARSATGLDPALTPAHLLLGMALYNQGREAEALASFEQALMLEPGNRVAAFYQALILGHQKQYDTALPVLYGLLASSTDAAETARILAEIDALYRFKAEPAAAGP